MNVFELASYDQIDRLAHVLLHSVWQTALIVSVAGLLAKFVWNRTSAAPVRYAIQTSAMASILFMPILTWMWVGDRSPASVALVAYSVETPQVPDVANNSSPNVSRPMESTLSTSESAKQPDRESAEEFLLSNVVPTPAKIPLGLTTVQLGTRCVVGFWLAGVGFFSLRLMRGLITNFRLQKNTISLTASLRLRIQDLASRLGWQRTPRVAVSGRVQQAVVTGYFRSIVLLPLSWTTQLPSDVLDAVIAHELAHMRRFDTWVILMQRITEALLFFHPAVWWLSGRISYERELSCDELAARATGSTDKYAAALEHIGRFVQHIQPASGCQLSPGLGGQKMELLHRIKHVLALHPDGSARKRTNPRAIAVLLPALWIGLIAAVMRVPVEAQVEETNPPANTEDRSAPAEGRDEALQEGIEIRETANRVYVELNHPATLNDHVMRMLKQAKKPVSLTARADIQFSPDEDIPRLISVPRLISLSLDLPVEDRHVRQLANLRELESLYMEGATLSRDSMQQLAKFPQLRHLGLWEIDVTDGDVRELLKLQSLTALQLQNCKITPAIIPEIAQKSRLTSLNLEGCPLRAADVARLSQLPNLQRLHISSVAHDDPFTGDAILSACSKFGKLKYLDIEGVTCTVDGIRQLNPSINLHNLNVSGTIGPIFYPKIGPAFLKARELRFAALYTTERSYFGGSANWNGSRFTLDAVYEGELISQPEYLAATAVRVPDGGTVLVSNTKATRDFPKRIRIRTWCRGMSDEEFTAENGQHSPKFHTTGENEQWAEGNPTRLHYATVEVTAKWDGGSSFCRGVNLDNRGLVAVPTELFEEKEDLVSGVKLSVTKAPLAEKHEAKIVGRHGPITLIRSETDVASSMPVSFTRPSTGDKVFAVEGVKWNDQLAIAGVLSGRESVTVPPTMESFSNKPVTHADLIVSNLPQSQEYLGTPLANEKGQLIGLCLPLPNSDGRGYAISVKQLRGPLNALAVQAKSEVASTSAAASEVKPVQVAWHETEAVQGAVVTVRGRHRVASQSAVRELISNGIIVHPDGQIVTPAETVTGADDVSITFGGETNVANVIGIDEKLGLALLEFEPDKPLIAFNVHMAPNVKVGDAVTTIVRTHTNPELFLQRGVLSSVNRTLTIDSERSLDSLLQFDFAISPAAAGAPLVNLNGNLVGVTNAVRAGSAKLGFAIPVADVVKSIKKIRKKVGLPEQNSEKVSVLPAVDPPSEEQILTKLRESPGRGIPWLSETKRRNVKIVIEKIADRIGQRKFYPTIGAARLRHCRYECTVNSDKEIRSIWPIPFTHSKPTTEVVIITKDRLIR